VDSAAPSVAAAPPPSATNAPDHPLETAKPMAIATRPAAVHPSSLVRMAPPPHGLAVHHGPLDDDPLSDQK
jgi:hypothetical protein